MPSYDVYDNLPSEPLDKPSYLTIGNFDGVHRGHQALISDMVGAAHAAGALAGALTFDPHPAAVLRPGIEFSYLTTIGERVQLLGALGLDYVVVVHFTRETANLTAAEFVDGLVSQLRLQSLWVGPDFALGKGREGDIPRLKELGQDLGYSVHVVSPFDHNGEAVRSSQIRTFLSEAGDVEKAAEMLGRAYTIRGEVVRGAGRGRLLGFPTANLAVNEGILIPAYGVYACWAWQGSAGHPSVISIGTRPTFDNGQPTVEAYLIEFHEDLYGEQLGLSFVKRLRGEERFESAEALIDQMVLDTQNAQHALANPPDHTEAVDQFWEELPHTADWAIRVHGRTQRQLFARAANAMFRLQEADPARPIELARAFSIAEENHEALLVAFLNELLLAQELGEEMYTRFEIHEVSHSSIQGVAYGYHGTPSHTEIKAVTFYDLSVRETGAGWTATVTFDV